LHLLTIAGLVAFLLTTLVVGVRWLLLAHKTRKCPELTIGFTFLATGAFGHVPAVAIMEFPTRAEGRARLVLASGLMALNTGCGTLFGFVFGAYSDPAKAGPR